jgi:ariadne-1
LPVVAVARGLERPIFTESQFMDFHDELVHEVSVVLDVHPDVAFELLVAESWRMAVLFWDYERQPKDLFERAGIKVSSRKGSLELVQAEAPGVCPVCWCDFEATELLMTACGHLACIDCWRGHFEARIDSREKITCVECGGHVSMSTIAQFVGPVMLRRYCLLFCEQDIQEGRQNIHCIRPECPFVLTIESVGCCGVATCKCGMRVCWHCRGEAHAPVTCDQMARWRVISEDKSVIQNEWEMSNTKPCPKCKARIEKNGGCNHMTCRSCSYEFCWICGHRWSGHNASYQCNSEQNFDDKFAAKAGDLERAAFFSRHYRAHQLSQVNEHKAKERTLMRLANLYISNGMRGDEASEFAIRAVSAVDTARSVLIWSYPYAFFMKPGQGLALFQHLQAQLAIYVDELTDCIENKADSSMETIVKFLMTVEKNTEVLILHCA